jgi:hypothetical protein
LAALGALSILTITTPASAEKVTITASGLVANGFDTTGLFGAPGTRLDGATFSYSSTFDLTNAGYTNDGNRSDIYGGEGYSYLFYDPPSLGGAVLKINGRQQSLNGQWSSWLLAYVGGPSFDVQVVQDRVVSGTHFKDAAVVLNETPSFGLLSFPNTAFPYGNLCAVADCSSSHFSFYESLDGVTTVNTYGNLSPSSITFTMGSVPEASIWAMMVVGIGGIGAAARSRRKPVLAAD